ncbi:hypothetical protein OYT13_15990 [Pandoraea sp. XJJ-1]|uniref:hypothetical protein n=1 Tax=Pandoraea sp. XJJ-1 TaxID=3002643 RepID=UPI00227E07C3|nr:hypothetical protein [Pandoraea sp. XJJ-1]WAL80997.1 hypothetical protein OYT13_14050 [Pandoraea sp. XJJ-1]WAL81352.1 hypothetical protein OYT13_15990 [Pandoraea sp. XJJ-1]
MNKFLDAVRTERTKTRYAVMPTIKLVFDVQQPPDHMFRGDDVYLFVTQCMLEVRTVAKSSHHDRVDMQARQALLGHLYGEAAQRVAEIQSAAYAEDILEVIELCGRLMDDMLTPTAKDRS